MRATAKAGREVFGYNRSVEGAQGASADGFDASTELSRTLTRAAATGALIVLAMPMPALPSMLAHVSELAPNCPLTDVTSVKSAVLDEVAAAGLLQRFVGGHPMTGTAESGWTAGHAGLFTMAPWVVSVDDHVDPVVWAMVMQLALDCGAVVVPAKSDEHDAAAAAISHRRTCWRRPWPSPPPRSRWPLRWPQGPSVMAPGWPPAPRTWCARCAKATPGNCCRSSTELSSC